MQFLGIQQSPSLASRLQSIIIERLLFATSNNNLDPRDEFVDPKLDRFRDNGNFMARSEITRRYDYGPAGERTPFKLRYRGN